jgi:hypothetical protein
MHLFIYITFLACSVPIVLFLLSVYGRAQRGRVCNRPPRNWMDEDPTRRELEACVRPGEAWSLEECAEVAPKYRDKGGEYDGVWKCVFN